MLTMSAGKFFNVPPLMMTISAGKFQDLLLMCGQKVASIQIGNPHSSPSRPQARLCARILRLQPRRFGSSKVPDIMSCL
ncbi:hypothetical protein DsansV1_C34g0226841 [Dioscorea sansibarensis]